MTQRLDGLIALATVLLCAAAAQAQDAPAPAAPAAPPAEEPPAAPPAEAPATPAPDAAPAAPAEAAPAEAAPAAPAPAPAEEPPAPAPTPEDAGASAEGVVSLDMGGEAAEAEAEADTGEGEEATEEKDDDVEEIVVTGSRVKRSDVFAASAPVEIISREQLEYSGASNLQDVIQYLTVAQGSGFQGESAGLGTNSINLRGLGAGATLVLINGRRVAPSGGGIATHYVDIGSIPMSAVDRIEILKGGGSAIYGTDAVGGVVNIITRQDWDGLRIEADAQTTDDIDQQDYTLSAAFGAASERSRLSVAMQYYRRTQLTAAERDWTLRADPVSTTGFPGTYLVGATTMPDPNCEDAPNSEIREGFCGFNFNEFQSLMGNMERFSVYAYGEYDITEHTSVFAETNVARTRTDGIFSPSFPFPPAFPTVPADHVDNPFGTDVGFIGRPLGAEAGPKINAAGDDTVRLGVGLKGDFEDAMANTMLEDWEWTVFMTAGQSRYQQLIHDVIKEEFQEALNSCSDPQDLSGCFNPFYSSILGTGTPNTDEVIATFDGLMENLTDHAMQTYNAEINGTLFELPGGDLGFAVGGEIRHEWRASQLDQDANQLRYGFLLGNSDAFAERDVYGAFGELVWPLYEGIEIQTAGRVEKYTDTDATSASPTVGITLRPAGIVGSDSVVEELRWLQLRGYLTRAFRAPTIYQSFPGFAVVPGLFTLPDSPLPVFVPVQAFGNPDLEPESATIISGGISWPVDKYLLIVADYWQYDYQDRISAESAQQILRNDIANQSMDDYVPDDRIEYGTGCLVGPCPARIRTMQVNTGDVFTNGIDMTVMFKLDGETFGGSADDWGTLTFGTTGTYTLSFEVPQSSVSPLTLEDGSPLTDDDGEPVYSEDCDGEVCEVAGKRNSAATGAPIIPQLRLNFPVSWATGGHAISATAHLIGGFEDDQVADEDGNFEDVDSMFTLDLQYGYTLDDTVGKALTFRVGVYNVFEAEPPETASSATSLNGFEPSVHDPRGRMFYAKLIQEF